MEDQTFKKSWLTIIVIFITLCGLNLQRSEAAETTPKEKTVANAQKEVLTIKIETTMGDIKAKLFQKEAPKTVENFVTLAQKGFYNGIIFHRVLSTTNQAASQWLIAGQIPTGVNFSSRKRQHHGSMGNTQSSVK